MVWVWHSDQIKSLNPLGEGLTAHALRAWNFGSLEQKLNGYFWVRFIVRTFKDLFGAAWLAPIFLLLPFCQKKTIRLVAVLAGLFLFPVLIFTNLYFAHNYYPYANGILLITAFALILGDLSERSRRGFITAMGLLGIILLSATIHYHAWYLESQGPPNSFKALTSEIERRTRPEDVLAIFGADWSSEIPYYAKRRSVMFPGGFTTPDRYRRSLKNLQAYRVGALVFCPNIPLSDSEIQEKLADFKAIGAPRYEDPDNHCVCYFPNIAIENVPQVR
jgi:hypothetical protein